MSIENRLAAKKRSQKARQRAAAKKAAKVVLAILIPVIIIGAVVGIYLNYQSKKIEYSKYVTADGSIKDVNAKDYLSELADYTNMDIKLSDYEPSEEDIEEELQSLYDAVETTDSDTETSSSSESEDAADDTEDSESQEETTEETSESVLDMITDEWVETNYASTLDEDYEHTKDGLVEYVTETLRTSNLESLRSDISTWLNENSTLKEYPKKYTKNLIQIYINEEKASFEEYESFYTLYGYSTVYELYGGKDAFEEQMESNAKSEVKTTLICLAIYEELNLTTSDDDVEAYYTEIQEEDYSALVEQFGEPYLKLQCKCAQVLDYLEDSVQ